MEKFKCSHDQNHNLRKQLKCIKLHLEWIILCRRWERGGEGGAEQKVFSKTIHNEFM